MPESKLQRPDSNEAIAARMILLRRAYSAAQGHTREMSQSAFARHCGIGVQALNNTETADTRIGLDNAMRVRAVTGVSLDFIYFGNRSGLPHAIAVEIEKIELAEKPARPRRASA